MNPNGTVKKSSVHKHYVVHPNQINATDKPQRTFKGKAKSPTTGMGPITGSRPVPLSRIENKQAYVR